MAGADRLAPPWLLLRRRQINARPVAPRDWGGIQSGRITGRSRFCGLLGATTRITGEIEPTCDAPMTSSPGSIGHSLS